MMLLWPLQASLKYGRVCSFCCCLPRWSQDMHEITYFFYCTVQNSNNFDGQITLLRELQDVTPLWQTHTYTQTAILPTGLTFPWSSKSFSMGSHLISKGLTDFISPSALYWRVCVWWLPWRVDRNRTSRQWHCRVYRVIPFRAELKVIALYPRSNFCSQNDQRQMWELQLFNQSESSSP